MKIILLITIFLFNYANAIEFGTLATGTKSGMYYKLGSDISGLFKKYGINLKPIVTRGSYDNLSILNGHYVKNKNTFFAIVQKDAISYYNYIQYNKNKKSIINKIPAIISLGIEQIHILANINSDFDFEKRKTYKVFCGDMESGTCITTKYIEKAYNFKFIYVNSKEDTVLTKLKEGMIDLVFKVVEKPNSFFQHLEDVKFIDLPTNFIMEDMYVHSELTKEDYPWIDEDIHAFAVQKVLVTNLYEKKYAPIMANIANILTLNKTYLEKNYGKYWKNVDFSYTNFKKMSRASKKVILKNLK